MCSCSVLFFCSSCLASRRHACHLFALTAFFNPWHGVLYSGLLVVAMVMGSVLVINHARGNSWQQAIPAGYELSLLGIFGFAIGGVGDMFWHILFGFERNIDAELSPTHLMLMISLGLIMAGPLRAAWRRSKTTLKAQVAAPHSLPFLLLLLLLVFTVLTQAANPFNTLWPTDTLKTQITEQTLAVVSIVLQTIILMGLILLTIRKWHLPFGFLTLVFTLNAMALSVMHNHYIIILIAALAGVIADVIYLRLQPSMARVGEFRLFACLVPGVLYLVYFLVLLVTSHIVWSVHLAVGSIILAGITGWLLSYLFVPLRDSM